MSWWPALAGFAAGAIVGSYIATLCLRWPRGDQATAGRSRCDRCGATLAARDLVPLVSAILNRGRCRQCGEIIDPFHWQVELSAALVGGFALAVAPSPQGMALALFGWLLLGLGILDLRHFWLPNRLTLALAAAGLVAGGWLAGLPLADRLIGGFAGFTSLWIIAAGYRRWRGREGLGAGDPKLLGAIGLWTGWIALPFILLLAALIGMAIAAARRMGRTDRLPFGSLLAVAGFLWAGAAVALG